MVTNTAKEKDPISDALHAIGATAPAGKNAGAKPEAIKSPALELTPEVKAIQTEAVAKKLTGRKLPIPRLTLQGYQHNAFDVTAERGTTLEDILQTDYWTHVAIQFKPFDTIHVLSEDGEWYARLLVISSDRLWAKMYKLEYHDLTGSYGNMPKTMEEEYDVRWTTIGKYAVLKKGMEGQPPLKDGFQTKLDAYQWLDGHLKAINR